MRKKIVFGTLFLFLLISMLMLPLVDADIKTDISPIYGVYDRLAAYNYAQRYWDEVCSDGYFVNTRTTFIHLDPGTDITGMTGYDCAHFVSCCIGNEPHEPGGGLDVPRTAPHIYGELGATWLGDWLITSGNGVEKPAISELVIGDVINYDWDGDGHWDHVALYLGGNEVAGHTTCVWEANWQLIGAADYRFIHMLSSPWIVDDDGSPDFHTIQEAINVASEGDTIFVRNGTYNEYLNVTKSLTILAENVEGTVVIGFEIHADNVRVSGFTMNAGAYSGVSLFNSSQCNISTNVVFSDFYPIALQHSSNNHIANNRIPYSVNGWGITLLIGCNNNTIRQNIISQQEVGIYIVDSHTNTLDCNELFNNNVAVYLDGSFNHIYHNNFVNNLGEVVDGGVNTWDNGCEGNYWSNYNGTDLNGDGIGDAYLPWESVDNYPLMNPYWNSGDINHDLKIDIYDVVQITAIYGSQEGDDNWNPHADITEPSGIIDIYDVVTCTKDYGQEYLLGNFN
jgi:nitrous oxidase accessory protein